MTLTTLISDSIFDPTELELAESQARQCKQFILSSYKQITSDILSLKVEDGDAYNRVTAIYSEARKYKKLVEEIRVQKCSGPRKLLADINDQAKELADPLDQIIQIANAKTTEYQRLLEDQKKIKEEKLKAQAALFDIEEDTIFVPEIPTSMRGNGATATTIVKKKFRILDLEKVPRKYFMLDEKALERDIKMGMDAIEGVEIYEEKSTTLRVR